MLNIQKYLIENRFDYAKLESELGISATFHPSDDRVILNYSQIDSPKTNIIVREARGLVLNKTNASIIARSFHRFFNWGEHQDEMSLFNWDDPVTITSKEDGSLIVMYYYNGEWHINTRGSFADGKVNGGLYTWKELFYSALGNIALSNFDIKLTYVFELCSMPNKVVREYKNPTIYLLSIFHNEHELSHSEMVNESNRVGLLLPEVYKLHSLEETQAKILEISQTDKTYEGVVIRDINNLRFKLKNPTYLALHRMRGNNDNMFHPKNILPFIISGETDELLCYFSEIKDTLEFFKAKYEDLVCSMCARYQKYKDEQYQKNFALGVKDHPLSSIMFAARKTGGDPAKLVKDEQFQKVLLYNLTEKG